MLKSSLRDYKNAYILVKEIVTVSNTETASNLNNRGKKVKFKSFAPFTDCLSKINNTQIDNAKDIDVLMPMYNLIRYNNVYSKTSSL